MLVVTPVEKNKQVVLYQVLLKIEYSSIKVAGPAYVLHCESESIVWTARWQLQWCFFVRMMAYPPWQNGGIYSYDMRLHFWWRGTFKEASRNRDILVRGTDSHTQRRVPPGAAKRRVGRYVQQTLPHGRGIAGGRVAISYASHCWSPEKRRDIDDVPNRMQRK